jgi:putative membrane protein
MMKLFINWFLATLAVMIATWILPGVTVSGFVVAAMTALVLGVINALLRPVLLILTLPLTVVSLGLFAFVINAFMVLLASRIVSGFQVSSFWWALVFSLVLSLVHAGFGIMEKRRV